MGFGLNLHAEADTGELILADEMYHYYLEHGAVKCRDSNVVNVPQISGSCLLALSTEQFQIIAENTHYLAELKRLMRFVINHHLGSKKLKSRELFKPVGQ